MTTNLEKSVSQKEHGFTLIELIMVIVIIGILVFVALPRYYANVQKAKNNSALATLGSIRQVILTYYAVYGAWPASDGFPFTTTLDGDVIAQIANPSNSYWNYHYSPTTNGCPGNGTWVYPVSGGGEMGLCIGSGNMWCQGSWCTTQISTPG